MDAPFMPTAEMYPGTKIETTWGVLQGYMDQVKERDAEIERLRTALDIARTGLLNIERRSEEARAELSKRVGNS